MSGRKKWEIDRRTFIQAGGMTLALPFLEAMLPSIARAAGESDPKRFVSMYIASGTYMKPNGGAFWFPNQPGPLNAGALPAVFQPFASNIGDLSILKGITNTTQSSCRGLGGSHSTAVATHLTCTPYTNGDSGACTIAGNSFDVEFANGLGGKSYAVSAGGPDGYHPDSTPFDYGRTVSYKNSQQHECYLNPYKLFYSAGLFMGNPASTQSVQMASVQATGSGSSLSRNRSILDSAYESIKALRGKVGKNDQMRIDDYFNGLREIEVALGGVVRPTPTPGPGSTPNPNPTPTPPQGGGGGGMDATCTTQAGPSKALDNEDHSGNLTNFADRLKAFCDIILLAFKCNRAQTFSFMFEYENTPRRFMNLVPNNLKYGSADMGNSRESHIGMAHWGDNPAEEGVRRDSLVTRDRFYMSYLIYLINGLKAARDPSGSPILDNTIIQLSHGLYDGNHGVGWQAGAEGLPMVVAGGRNVINPGNFYAYSNTDLKDLYYTIARKSGVNMGNFRGSTKMITL